MASTTIVFLLLCVCGLSWSQAPQCNTLNVDSDGNSAQTGTDLDVCTTTSLQCCTQSYLNQVKREARSRLLRGLEEQLDDRLQEFNGTVRMVVQYFTTTFPQVFASHIPNIQQFGDTLANQITQTILEQLLPVFTSNVPMFDAIDFIDRILAQLDNAAISFLNTLTTGGLNDEQQACIRRFINQIIDTQVKTTIAHTLNQVQQGLVTLNRIVNFLGTFNRTAATYQISDGCVRRLIELSFCGRCTNRLPPLCNGTCGALVRGCYAPFVTGLDRAFNNLWNVSRQIVMIINMNIAELLMNEDQLLNGQTILQLGFNLARDCNLQISIPSRKKRQATQDELIPSRVLEDMRRLQGVFRYDNGGPDFCQPSDDEQEFCRGNRDDDDDDRNCDSESVCTSSCQCWDGTGMQEVNQVTFDLNGIEDQDKNPVFEQNPEDLIMQAQMFSDPVNAFLTSEEFSTVVPDGVTVPAAAPFTGRGESVMTMSLLGLLLVVSVCALLIL